jgi:hypothetical protein
MERVSSLIGICILQGCSGTLLGFEYNFPATCNSK